MHFSGKISNSILNYLDRQGLSREQVLDLTDVPVEILKDPTAWIDASELEKFLDLVERELTPLIPETGEMMKRAGHAAPELKAWGVLDSVLRMMSDTKDIFAQPQRFISYFVSPEPPIGDLRRSAKEAQFSLPFSALEYPRFAEYLRSAIEALPGYQGQPFWHVSWDGAEIHIHWAHEQSTFFSHSDMQNHLKPDFVAGLIQTLESAQKQIEEQKRELALKEAELKQKSTLEKPADGGTQPASAEVQDLKDQVMRLMDYFSRAHQLVTLLIGQDRMDRQVQEAMRRVDWSKITDQFPTISHKLVEGLEQISTVKAVKPKSAQGLGGEERLATDLNRLVEEVVSDISPEELRLVRFEKMLFLDRPVRVKNAALKSALSKFLHGSLERLTSKSRIRIVTRPVNGRAELEISEFRAQGEASPVPELLDYSSLENVVRDHEGRLNCQQRGGEGATLIIELPT